MKKSQIILLLLLASIILTGVFYLQSKYGFAVNKDKISDEKLERLFKDLGILKPPVSFSIDKLTLFDLNRKPVKLTEYQDTIVFLNFFATWCPPCRDEMPFMEKLHKANTNKPFRMVAVSVKESSEPVKTFFNKQRLTFTPLLDPNGDVGRHFRIRSIPTTFILDKKGKVLGVAMGPRDWSSKKSLTLFKHLMNT